MNKQKTYQAELDRVQTLYREWTQLLPELEADAERWQQAAYLIKELHTFYAGGTYRELYEAEENGMPLNTKTQGEYSVLSEDAVWDALHDFRDLAWRRLRGTVHDLDTLE